jgi:hypothetical protein
LQVHCFYGKATRDIYFDATSQDPAVASVPAKLKYILYVIIYYNISRQPPKSHPPKSNQPSQRIVNDALWSLFLMPRRRMTGHPPSIHRYIVAGIGCCREPSLRVVARNRRCTALSLLIRHPR